MPGIIINGIKYIQLCNSNELKKKSLEDNVYFTLRDIFINAETSDDIMRANLYNNQLTHNIYFEDRTNIFEYTKILEEKYFVKNILRWLLSITKEGSWFDFVELEDGEEIIMEEYMMFEDWWVQLEDLIVSLEHKLTEIIEEK